MPVLSFGPPDPHPAGSLPVYCGSQAGCISAAAGRCYFGRGPCPFANRTTRTTLRVVPSSRAPDVPALTDFKFTSSDLSSRSGTLHFPESRLDGLERFEQESSHEREIQDPKMAAFDCAQCFGDSLL